MTNQYSPYLQFSREDWSQFRHDTPMTLSEDDLAQLRGQIEPVSATEVEEIYLPLSRLLNLYIEALQGLYQVTSTFLGNPQPKVPYVIAVSGSVAVGKSTTSRILRALLSRWPSHRRVDIVTTDGFLYPTAILEERGLMERKGFPESYDTRRLVQFLSELKAGKPGQTFLSAIYNNAKQSLFELASQRGYFHAKLLKSVVRVNLKTYRADIVLHFKTGPRYHFGQVTFSKAPFDEAFLYRFVPFQPGQLYTSKLLHQFENALRDSHYFQQALVDLQREKTRDLTIPIHVTLVPVKAKRYTLGIGYSTDIGVHGFASAELRRLTRTGHHLAAYIKPSFFETKGRIEYIIPGENPTTDSYKLSAAILKEFQTRPSTSRSSRRKNPVGEEQGQNVSYSYTTTLNGWQKTLALTFLDARFHNTGQPLRNAHFLFPSLLVLKLKSDDILHPTQGYRISILLRGASNDIASTHSFLQARLDAKLLKKLTEYQRVILRGSVGYTDINDIFNLPISLQFLEGGATSVRGYAFQSIGPGKALLVGSAEFQQKVIDDWYAVVYFDAGQVSPRLTGRFNRSVGVGAVWLSPIGAVGLSLARKINHPDKSLHIVLSIGPQL